MIFGHNTNVSVGAHKYHVQTEDAGASSALIDTTVYAGGRVLHRRTNNYLDLLPLNADSEKALKLRLDEQHRQVLEEIRTGVLHLPEPTPPAPLAPTKPVSSQAAVKNAASGGISIHRIAQPKNLARREARHFAIACHRRTRPSGRRRKNHRIRIRCRRTRHFFRESTATGEAHVAFDMPRLSDPNAALLIEATRGAAKAQLRFQLRRPPARSGRLATRLS